MQPYKLNVEAIDDFKKYFKLKTNREVAERFGISESYLSLLLAGVRPLNDVLRFRIQQVTGKPQDELFVVNKLAEVPFNHQSFSYHKFFGVLPYDEFSPSKYFRDQDEHLIPKDTDDPRSKHFKRKFFKKSDSVSA